MKKIMIALIALIPIILIFTVQITTTYIESTTYISVEKVLFEDDEKTIKKESDNDVVLYYPATVMPLAATDKNVIYSSSDTSIATVDKDGNITFKDFGKVVITAKSAAFNNIKDECEFLVTDDKAHRISVLNEIDYLYVGETHYLQTSIIPEEALDKNLTYSSSDTNVATISPDGLITAVDGGFTNITVTTANGKTCSFTLQVKVSVESIKVMGASKKTTGQSTMSFPTIEFTPYNSTNKNLTYSSSDNSVATISSSGQITFVKAGEITFTATSEDGKHTAEYVVEYTGGFVKGAEIVNTEEKFEFTFVDMAEKEIALDIKITPSDAVMTNVWWTSSNDKVVKIIDGKPVVCGGGNAVITLNARTLDGSLITANKEVYVLRPASQIIVNNVTNDVIEINETEFQLNYTILTSEGTTDHTDKITLEVDSNIASITQSGLVSFDSPGDIKVTIKANENTKKQITIKYIPAGATEVKITENNQQISLNYGQNVVFVFDGIDMGTPTYTVSGKSANNVDVITFDSASQIFTASNGGDSVVVASGNVNITINVNVVRNVNDIQYNVIGVQEVDGVISTALKSFQITSSTLPLDASNREVVVSVNDTNTATYNNSVITFLKSGTVTISLTALRNFSGSETIEKTIIATSTFGLATKFNVDEKIVIEDVGLSKNITFGNTFNPSDYTFDITHYTFSSLDSAIASVNNNGVILGKKWGTTTIYVSTNVLGSTITKSIVVEVQEKSDSVDFTFNGKIVNGGIILGDSITLGSKITPSETNNKSVRYCITEVVDGDVSDVVINETSGLLTFYKACTVKVTVETLDNGTTKTILIKKLTGPNELRVYYNENLVEDIIKLPANSANPILKVQPYVAVSNDFPDGILDFDLNEIDFSSENETGLSIVANITDVGNFRYYTIVPTKTAVKSLATTITLRYGSTSEIVQIKFYSLQGISLVLDNEDDIEFGLEQTRVFGSYFNDNWNWGNKMKVEFTNTPTNVEDQLYWFVKASDTHYASFPSALSNEIQLNTNNINSALSSMTNFEGAYPTIKVTVFVGNESDYSLYDNLLTTPSTDPTFKWDYYTFTIVNGCNIFDGDDFDYAWQKYQRMVLHANIGTEEDRVEGQNFGTMSDTTKNTSNHMVDVYGNGYTLNFEGHLGSTNSVNEIPIYGDAKQYGVITNVNYKGQNIDSTKKTYTRSLVMYGGIMQYTTVQGFDLLYVTQVTDTSKGYYTDLKFYRCIFRHTSKCGLQLDGINRKQYVEDCIFYDVAQCAIDFQEGELYIKGFCDIYNFVTPSEYDSKYQSVIKDAFNSSEFSAYVDKSSGNSSTYQANVGICVASVASSPSVDTVYFWNESTQSYVANVDNLTGHKFTKISKTKTILFVVKVYLHMWLMPLDGATIKPVTSSSVPGDGSIPNLQKLYRIQ